MIGLETHHDWATTVERPVHNVFLWLGADVGLFGAVTFFFLGFCKVIP